MMIRVAKKNWIITFSKILLALLFLLPVHTVAYAQDELILAVHPYLPDDELRQKFKPLADFLGRQTGQTINVKVGSSYAEHIQYIGLNKVDIAYMGPASYVRLVEEFGSKPVLARLEIHGNPWFQGNIVVRKDSGITTLDDLKGKNIAYGDPNSTMSYIVPHYMLQKSGVFTDPLSRYRFLYSHNDVALAVLAGDFDAGAVKPAVFRKFEKDGLRTIAKTPRISEHLFVARSNLPIRLVESLRDTLLNMKNSADGMQALRAVNENITGLVEASSDDYRNLHEILIELPEL